MAGSWIKMRASLRDKPEVIRMCRYLMEDADFREWLTPGGGGSANGQIVSNSALRAVTCGALLLVWSNARENGKFILDDLFLEGVELGDLDEMACPGLGVAMERVGWAKAVAKGVILPRFRAYNVPMDNAERQAAYRQRERNSALRQSNGVPVTSALPEGETEKRIRNTPLSPPKGGHEHSNGRARRQRPLTPDEAVRASRGEPI